MERISGNAIVIKEVNMNLVRKALRERGSGTKQQLAEATGLSLVTVGTVLQQLLQTQEVKEGGLASSRGGRPAQEFKYNEDYAQALIVYTHEQDGRITVRSTVVNLYGKAVHQAECEVEGVNIPVLERIIDGLLAEYPAVQAIGLGLPGAEFAGTMVVSDYKELIGQPVTAHLQERYGVPVIMENDVNAAVLGFSKNSGLPKNRTVVYIYFPELYPPGSGIMIQGKLHKGKGNFAGEISWLPLGIDWTEAGLYASFERLSGALAKLIVTLSSILNPDTVVLYGSSLTPEHLPAITGSCRAQLPAGAVPELLLSKDFAVDYIGGMIERTLATLEPDIVLSRHSVDKGGN
ncbi:hypothetical protein GCM10010912_15010 [Paenibacillus albidus]|uniref:ROK family protein n=1 Tax=Paenibacillus albidus TaxID=2041023 RepID=A0A917FDH4_9BACL|nr:ROK family protein [Paenibacillus albidus]GGF70786.1 hypothetical protein GCM10010912_15010 [Paenibacillus albidus]